jgi:hypothetical protein
MKKAGDIKPDNTFTFMKWKKEINTRQKNALHIGSISQTAALHLSAINPLL